MVKNSWIFEKGMNLSMTCWYLSVETRLIRKRIFFCLEKILCRPFGTLRSIWKIQNKRLYWQFFRLFLIFLEPKWYLYIKTVLIWKRIVYSIRKIICRPFRTLRSMWTIQNKNFYWQFSDIFQTFLIFSRTRVVLAHGDYTHLKENCLLYQKNLMPTHRKSSLYMKILEKTIFRDNFQIFFNHFKFVLEYLLIKGVKQSR